MIKPTKWLCIQQRLRSPWTSSQSDRSLRCALDGKLRILGFFTRTAKTLIQMGRCPGWSESSLGTHVILLVLSCGGSYNLVWPKYPSHGLTQLLYLYGSRFFLQFLEDPGQGLRIHPILTQSNNCGKCLHVQTCIQNPWHFHQGCSEKVKKIKPEHSKFEKNLQMSRLMTKPTKWHVRPGWSESSLGAQSFCHEVAHMVWL